MTKCAIAPMEICTKLQYNAVMERDPLLDIQRVRDEMQRLGLKIPALATQIGVAYETLYKALNEENRRVSAEMVARLAAVFGCSIEYLLGLTDEREPRGLELGEVLSELTQIAKRLPSRRQRDLLLTAKAYLEDSEAARFDPDRLMEDILALIEEAGSTLDHDQLIDFLNEQGDDEEDDHERDDGPGLLPDNG